MKNTGLSCGVAAVLFSCLVASAGAAPYVTNHSFEDGALNPWPGYGPIAGWNNLGGSGNNDATGPFNNGLPIPDGGRVAFSQGAGAGISQTISGFEPGKSYTVQYFENERGEPGAVAVPAASLGGQTVVAPHQIARTDAYRRVVSQSFVATSTSHDLVLSDNAGGAGDNTVLWDNVQVTRAVPIVANGGFEDYVLEPNSFEYTPNGQPNVGWTFSGSTGLSRNLSAWQLGDPVVPVPHVYAPEGNQIAFMQGSTLSQTISGFELGVTYSVSWLEQTRLNFGGDNNLTVLLNGEVVFGSHLVDNTTWIEQTSNPFVATSESMTLTFLSNDPPLSGDNTVLLDDVHFNFVIPEPASLAMLGLGGALVALRRRRG